MTAILENPAECQCGYCKRGRRARQVIGRLSDGDREWLYNEWMNFEEKETSLAWIQSTGLITCHFFEGGGGI